MMTSLAALTLSLLAPVAPAYAQEDSGPSVALIRDTEIEATLRHLPAIEAFEGRRAAWL